MCKIYSRKKHTFIVVAYKLIFHFRFCSRIFRSSRKMLAVFEKAIANPPQEPSLPLGERQSLKTGEEIAKTFWSSRSDSTLYKLSDGNFMSLSHQDEIAAHPRSIVVMENIFCIFSGCLYNTICQLSRHYGLSRQAAEAMVMVEAYKLLRDQAPYPAGQVVKELDGKFTFILYDAKVAKLFLARDRDGSMQLHSGVTADGSLVFSDDSNIINDACGHLYTLFPPVCLFMSDNGLISFDHLLNNVRAIVREEDDGKSSAYISSGLVH